MNVNGVTGAGSAYDGYTSKTKQAEKKDATTKTEESVVYEPASTATKTESTKKGQRNQAVINQLKADQQARMDQLQSIVLRSITKQGNTYNNANNIWSILSSGNFTVDAATKAQAQADIAEDGYWGVKATSGRIIDFAMALTGGDTSKMEEMKAAFEKGYKQAEKTWGGKLPDICQQTYDAVFKKFDDMIAANETATE